ESVPSALQVRTSAWAVAASKAQQSLPAAQPTFNMHPGAFSSQILPSPPQSATVVQPVPPPSRPSILPPLPRSAPATHTGASPTQYDPSQVLPSPQCSSALPPPQ